MKEIIRRKARVKIMLRMHDSYDKDEENDKKGKKV